MAGGSSSEREVGERQAGKETERDGDRNRGEQIKRGERMW